MIISGVPTKTNGFELYVTINPNPSTMPGTMYRIIIMESKNPVRTEGFRAITYPIRVPNTTTINTEAIENKKLLRIASGTSPIIRR